MLIDAGNAHYLDTRRREAALKELGLHFVGAGVSGGEEGALHGPSIMPGRLARSRTSRSARCWRTSRPRSTASRAACTSARTAPGTSSRWCTTASSTPTCSSSPRRTTCSAQVGGHSPAEIARDLPGLERGPAGLVPDRDHRRGAQADRRRRPASRSSTSWSTRPSRRAPAAGPCRRPWTWACRSAASPSRCSPGRCPATPTCAGGGRRRAARPGRHGRRAAAATCRPTSSRRCSPRRSSRTRRASSRSRRPARSTAGTIDPGAMAKIWRAGCIIRAKFLDFIKQAYDKSPGAADAAGRRLLPGRGQRRAGRLAPGGGATAAQQGIPAPGLRLGAGLLRRPARQAPAGRPDPGAARLLRRAHVPPRRQGRRRSTPCGRPTSATRSTRVTPRRAGPPPGRAGPLTPRSAGPGPCGPSSAPASSGGQRPGHVDSPGPSR